jgi:hypothetical protein
MPEKLTPNPELKRISLNSHQMSSGTLPTEPGITISWMFYPPHASKPDQATWLVVLDEAEPLAARPDWLIKAIGDEPVLLVAPRNSGPMRWQDSAPFYIQRSLPLLGRTVDSGRLADVLAVAAQLLRTNTRGAPSTRIIGRGSAGVIAAYVALLEPRVSEVVVVDPPASHRTGPIFLNVLRVVDVPEALGLLAPRPLTVYTSQAGAFDPTASIYRVANAELRLRPLP